MSRPVNWEDQRAFLAVLEEGSLSAAARRLGLTQPTVRARIEALEQAIGTKLFIRSVHGLTPTEQAHSLHATAKAMSHASDAFVRAAASQMSEPTGTVRLSVAEFVGVEVVPPMLARLSERYPAIAIELELSNDSADLLEQQVDVAVRMYPPRHGALVAKKVATIDLRLYAHPSYLARHGEPVSLDDLKQHRMIGPDRNRADLAVAAAKFPWLERRDFLLRTDSHPAWLAAARAGLGIAVVHRPIGDADPQLRPVLPEFSAGSMDTWIVTHENLRDVSRIRAVFDHLASEFAAYAGGSKQTFRRAARD